MVLTFFSFLFLKTLTFHPADQLPLVGPETGIKKRGGEEFLSSTAWLVAQTVFFLLFFGLLHYNLDHVCLLFPHLCLTQHL